MGIFGKLFKKTEINKCEICGEIINSDFSTCSSCKKTSATTTEAPTFNGINPHERINLMQSIVNINGKTVFAQWAEEVSKSLEEGINIFDFYIKYYFFQEFNPTSLDIDEEKSLFTRFKKDRVFRERFVLFFPNNTEFFHKTIIEAVGKELITNKNFENTNKIIESKRQGLWVTYYENGNLNELSDSQQVDLFKHGIKPKKLQELVPTVVMTEGTWKDNQREGLWKLYHQNGKLSAVGEFKDDDKIGLWKVYDKNGQLIGGVNTDGDKDEIFEYTPEDISIITFFNKYISKDNKLEINTTSSFKNNTYYGKCEDDDRGTILIFFEKAFDVVEEFKNIIELHCSQNPFFQLNTDEIANWIISNNDGVIEYNNIEGCSIQLSKGANLYRIDVFIEDTFSWNTINKVNTQKSLIFTFPFTSPIKYRLPKVNFNFNETESLILISIYFNTLESDQVEIPLYDNLFDEDTINLFIQTEEFKRFWAYACNNIFVDTVDPLQTDFFENIFNVLKEYLSSFEMLNLSFTFINKPQKIISIQNNDLEAIIKKNKKVKLISELTRLNNFFNIPDGEFILFSMMKKQMTLVEPYLNRFKDLQDLFESMKNESSDSAIELRKKIVGDMPLNLIDRPTDITVEKDEVSNTSSDKSKTKEVIEYHDNGKLLKKGILDIDEKPHGNFKFWFPSGNIQMDGNFIHGVNHGSYKEYFENGNLHKEFNYKNGEQHGINNEYYEDGNKNIVCNFNEGELHGLREQYYPSGSLEMRTTYNKGIKEGVHTYLDEQGEIIEQKVMKDGLDIMPQLIKLVYNGDEIMQSLFTDESEKVEKWTMAQRMYDYVKNNNLNVESSEVLALNKLFKEGKITKEFYDMSMNILKKTNQ